VSHLIDTLADMRNDAFGAVSDLLASQHGCISRSQANPHLTARDLRKMVRDDVLLAPFPNVFVLRAAPRSDRQTLMAATLAGGGSVASHTAAAWLHGLDGFESLDLEVSVARPRHIHPPGVRVHQVSTLPTSDVMVLDGIPCTGLARTLVDLGSVRPTADVERALDDGRRRGASLRWMTETAQRLHRPGQRGTTTLLELISSVDPDRVRDSWFEALIELIVDVDDLPSVLRQFVLGDDSGRQVARFDLAMPSIKLAIEAHSRRFHFGCAAERRDEDRDLAVGAMGWDVMYLGWQHTKAPDETLEVVRSYVTARRRELAGQNDK